MQHPKNIPISDYTYDLPADRIALHPLEERDASRLLVYRNGQISETRYRDIAEVLPPDGMLVLNNTRVINARLRFKKPSGGQVEIFCLEPAGDLPEYSTAMNRTGSAQWFCMAGNAAKWKDELLELNIQSGNSEVHMSARKLSVDQGTYLIEFSWLPASWTFAEILGLAGDVPLPPYIKRSTVDEDKDRYQTIFAEEEGSVAAPTAGLHFTERVFADIARKGIRRTSVTLHVGAGTFRPVKADTMEGHDMHAEWIDVSVDSIQSLANHPGRLIAVGTTSLRTIESLYWLGVKAHLDPFARELQIHQWDAYEPALAESGISKELALESLVHWIRSKNRNGIFTQTQLLIAPGYRFRMAEGLITNFHQPQSTLLLLVAAAAGPEWKSMYAYALENGFRFLSYGDGSYIEFRN